MTPFRFRRLALLVPPLMLAVPAAAQFVPQPTPNADRLAEQMRVLAANPRDLYALIQAGELSTRLEDAPAAMAFFARAAAIDPSNPHIAAGRAGAFVLLERPGEALRLYAQAERAGVAMAPYLLQRGLAYDLTGQSGYAQRDYRAVLARGSDDEATRRLALSLGIVGRRDEALAVLDPLLRRSDRAAWRARACILALGGDAAGGERIAANMLAGGQALAPFLRRLPALSIADRAFAVHFGDLVSTPERQADARLAPVLAPLPSEPPVAVAAVVPAVRAAASGQRTSPRQQQRGSRPVDYRDLRARPGRTALQPTTARPPAVAAITPRPQLSAATPTPPPVQLASRAIPTPVVVGPPSQSSPAPVQQPVTPASTQLASQTPSPPPYQVFTPPTRRVAPQPIPMGDTTGSPPLAASPPAAVASKTSTLAATPPTPTPTPVTTSWAASADAAPTASPPVQTAAVAPAAAPPARAGLDSIIGTIVIPAEELEVRPVRIYAPAAKPTVPKAAIVAKPKPTPELKAKPGPLKAEPPRWWVQIAGGARVVDLDNDWRRLAAKSPTAFRGKAAWTTPLRATNRLLAGPFKSQSEAQVFVNAVNRDGLSAFAWQSEAGQKIEPLAL